jgi:hypothetical protein
MFLVERTIPATISGTRENLPTGPLVSRPAGGSQLGGQRAKESDQRHTISGRAAKAIMPRLP